MMIKNKNERIDIINNTEKELQQCKYSSSISKSTFITRDGRVYDVIIKYTQRK